jgi:endonuclease YncB( thermonuclease family)
MGCDCPETYCARCESERARGNAAMLRLQQLLAGAKKVDLIADGRIDRYGRQLGRLRVDGKEMGQILIRERLCVLRAHEAAGLVQRRLSLNGRALAAGERASRFSWWRFPGRRGTAHMVRIAREGGVEVVDVT